MTRPCPPIGIIIKDFETPMSLERVAAGDYSNGVWVDGAKTTRSIHGCVVPLSSREQELMPEGVRTKETIKVFTRIELQTASADRKTSADVILYRARRYEVFRVMDWCLHGDFYECVCVLQGAGG